METAYSVLMKILSTPRPSGSQAERNVLSQIKSFLDQNNISFISDQFRLYPYFMICIGAWLIISRSLLAVSIWNRWGWVSSGIALIGLAGGLMDIAFNIHLVTWIGARRGENLIIELGAQNPQQEIVLSAHYDSKTELLDHHQRMFFVKQLPLGIFLSVFLGILGPVDAWLYVTGSSFSPAVHWLGVVSSLVLLVLAYGLGINMAFGRLRKPSSGAVDNGAACAILVGLAKNFQEKQVQLSKTRLTLALFGGEEMNMQGSRAYVNNRTWSKPVFVLNLETMAQDGGYIYWEQDGTSLKLLPTSAEINQLISKAVYEQTGEHARPSGPVNSDGGSFLLAGIPATTLGTLDTTFRDRGFHSQADNMERVHLDKIPEAIQILSNFIISYDQR